MTLGDCLGRERYDVPETSSQEIAAVPRSIPELNDMLRTRTIKTVSFSRNDTGSSTSLDYKCNGSIVAFPPPAGEYGLQISFDTNSLGRISHHVHDIVLDGEHLRLCK